MYNNNTHEIGRDVGLGAGPGAMATCSDWLNVESFIKENGNTEGHANFVSQWNEVEGPAIGRNGRWGGAWGGGGWDDADADWLRPPRRRGGS